MKNISKIFLFSLILLLFINSVFGFEISLNQPGNNTVIGPIITSGYPTFAVNVTISADVNISLVNLTIGGTEICSNNSEGLIDYYCAWDVSTTGDGIYTIIANATNSSDGVFTSAINESQNVTIDSTAPVVTINSPINGLNTTNNSIVFNWTVSDALDAGALMCNLTINDVLNSTLNYSNGTTNNITLARGDYTNGTHYWNISCTDHASNTNTIVTYAFTIDTVIPSLYLIAPATGISSETVTPNLQWNVTDNVDTSLTCSVINNDANVGTTEATNASITSYAGATFPVGNSNWNITCTDDAGNTNSSNETRLYNLIQSGTSTGGGGSSYFYNNEIENRQIEPTTGGYAALIYSYETPKLVVDSIEYDLRLHRILFDKIDLKIDDTITRLEKDQETKIDINGDDVFDLAAEVTRISFNNAKIIFTKLVTEAPKIEPIKEPEPEPIEEVEEVEEEPEKTKIQEVQEAIEEMPPEERADILWKAIALVIGVVVLVAFLMWPEVVRNFFKK